MWLASLSLEENRRGCPVVALCCCDRRCVRRCLPAFCPRGSGRGKNRQSDRGTDVGRNSSKTRKGIVGQKRDETDEESRGDDATGGIQSRRFGQTERGRDAALGRIPPGLSRER